MTNSAARLATFTRSRFRAVAWIVLFAFTFQSFITQTHIHGAAGARGAATFTKTLVGGVSHNKAPAQDSTTDCPFCQAITHAGAFFTPSAPGLLLPVIWTAIVAIHPVIETLRDLWSYPWHSRAPPQH